MQASRRRSAIRIALGYGMALALMAMTGKPAAASEIRLRNATVDPLDFRALNGWTEDNHAVAFATFLKSCGAILNGTKAMRRARPVYGGLYAVCERATTVGLLDNDQARAFFENNFAPVRVVPIGQTEGFFTGYYETQVDGSRYPSDEYTVPLYRPPKGLIGRSTIFGSLNRTQIEDGALAGKGLEICWVKDPIDAFFAQIQGSTRVKLENGGLLRLNYIASNGQRYTPVGRWLIDQGIIAKEDMSMDRIREWMEAHPAEAKELRRKNRSFVFFTETDLGVNDECIGSQGVPLTGERSLAVDKNIHVYGTPIWIEAELPIKSEKPDTEFRHLMFAQDTGSAIVGAARADIYFGSGEEIGHVAGRVKQYGRFVMLVPRGVSVAGGKNVPLPKPKPIEISPDPVPTSALKHAGP
jgi:peptidoglycan lytic transglycosylase A